MAWYDNQLAQGGHWVTLENDQKVLLGGDGTIQAGLGSQNVGKTFAEAFNKGNTNNGQDQSAAISNQINGIMNSHNFGSSRIDANRYPQPISGPALGINQSKNGMPQITGLPELKGTEKQVNWANKIRNDSLVNLVFDAQKRMSPDVLSSRESMANYIDSSVKKQTEPFSSEELRAEKADLALSRLEEGANMHQRLSNLAGMDSASFWIDNRFGTSAKYRTNNLFKDYVSGKIDIELANRKL